MATRFIVACLGVVAVPVLTAAVRPQSQTATAPATFEVASVKRNASGDVNSGIDTRPGGVFVASNVTLRSLIRNAYRVQASQIEGGPAAWLDSDRFDVNARAGGPATVDQMATMLRALLAERFKLAVRTESREMPVLALVLVRRDGGLGPQMRASPVDCEALRAKSDGPPRPAADGIPVCAGRSRAGVITARGVTMTEVARNITSLAGSFVIDRTGLTGGYDFDLQWAPEAPPGEQGKEFADGPSFSTALQEQLGLKLERQSAPVEFLVIARAEHPEAD